MGLLIVCWALRIHGMCLKSLKCQFVYYKHVSNLLKCWNESKYCPIAMQIETKNFYGWTNLTILSNHVSRNAQNNGISKEYDQKYLMGTEFNIHSAQKYYFLRNENKLTDLTNLFSKFCSSDAKELR